MSRRALGGHADAGAEALRGEEEETETRCSLPAASAAEARGEAHACSEMTDSKTVFHLGYGSLSLVIPPMLMCSSSIGAGAKKFCPLKMCSWSSSQHTYNDQTFMTKQKQEMDRQKRIKYSGSVHGQVKENRMGIQIRCILFSFTCPPLCQPHRPSDWASVQEVKVSTRAIASAREPPRHHLCLPLPSVRLR